MNIRIYLDSVVCDAARQREREIVELSKLAETNSVEVEFEKDFVRLTAHFMHKIKVPKKAMTPDGLVEWLRNKIETAWENWE